MTDAGVEYFFFFFFCELDISILLRHGNASAILMSTKDGLDKTANTGSKLNGSSCFCMQAREDVISPKNSLACGPIDNIHIP